MKYILIIILIILIIYMNVKKIEPFENQSRNGYIINLDERTDRLNNVIKRFEPYTITLYRIPAIRDSVGWKGCGYSHISVIKMAKEQNLPSVLIIEDDCVPTEHFKNWFVIQEWLDKHRTKWDIFIGGNSYYGFWTNEKDNIKPLCQLEDIKLYKTKIAAFHFYYVNSSAYDKMLEWETNKSMPIDLWPDNVNLNSISCTPFIALQEPNYSNIEKSVRDYSVQMKTSETLIASIQNNSVCEEFQNFSTVAYGSKL
jgi:GR25 family glycosyltransferase involved in LPS biosynthesis